MANEMDTEVNTEYYLELFSLVRQLLKQKGGIKELDLSFPIRELTAEDPELHFVLGFCVQIHEGWVPMLANPNIQIAQHTKITDIYLRIYPVPHADLDSDPSSSSSSSSSPSSSSSSLYCSEKHSSEERPCTDAGRQEPFSLIQLLPTFLHELAHSITPGIMIRGHNPESSFTGKAKGGKRTRCWSSDDHGPEFYKQFRRILQAAEALQLYELPAIANKFSIRNMKRIDDFDVGQAKSILGSIPLLKNLPRPIVPSTPNASSSKSEESEEEEEDHSVLLVSQDEMGDPGSESSASLMNDKFDLYNSILEHVQRIQFRDVTAVGPSIDRQSMDTRAIIMPEPLRLTVCNSKGVKKSILLSERTLDALLKSAGQKLRCKPKKAFTSKGDPISDRVLRKLRTDDLVNIA